MKHSPFLGVLVQEPHPSRRWQLGVALWRDIRVQAHICPPGAHEQLGGEVVIMIDDCREQSASVD